LTPLSVGVETIERIKLMSEEKENIPEGGRPGHYTPPTVDSVTHQPPVTPAAASGQTTTDEASGLPVDYNDYTVAELKDLAHKRGIEVHSDMLKEDIIKALKKADKAG
jgi:hypothetical protein